VTGEALRVGFVPGVMPDTWARRWAARNRRHRLDLRPLGEDVSPVRLLDERELDMALVRLPVPEDADLHVVRLYDEQPVVVVSREHPVAAYDEIDVSDLADEHLLQDPDDVPAWRAVATEVREGTGHPVPAMTTAQAVATVATGAGVLVVPMSVARLHHRRDVAAVPVTGVAGSTVALVWRRDRDDEVCQELVAVVRGRTAGSSRG
jgi:DNA-binding transcriptional LysR family regulator